MHKAKTQRYLGTRSIIKESTTWGMKIGQQSAKSTSTGPLNPITMILQDSRSTG